MNFGYKIKNRFSYKSTETKVVCTLKTHLNWTFFELPKHMLKLMDKKIFITFYTFFFISTYKKYIN